MCHCSRLHRRQFLKQTLAVTLPGMGLAANTGCQTAPETGRKQLLLVPESQEMTLGAQAFEEVKTEAQPSRNSRWVELVQRVGKRIARHADRDDFEWQFELFESEEQNAFCLPGGKVAIYEGILPVCQNEAGLAVVMSHEIAHALARHGGERMSQSMAVDGVKQIANRVARKHVPSREELLMQAYGVGSQYLVLLPYNRKQESEADHIGVMLMSRAGYDPSEAPRFWSRFASLKTEQPIEFLSTHPSDQRRSDDLNALLEEAREYYRKSDQVGLGQSLASHVHVPSRFSGSCLQA